MTVQKLRQLGYKVKVRHTRFFDEYGVLDSGEFDNFLTRGEFERAYDDGDIVTIHGDSEPSDEFSAYSNLVKPFGGFTSVTLTAPDGHVYTGKFNFNNKPFSRKVGYNAALGRAFKMGNLREEY